MYKRLMNCSIETIILNTSVFLVFYQFNPMRESFLTLNLHPLVIITAAMALKYGNYLGLLSASTASLTYFYVYHLLGKDLMLFFWDFSNYKFMLMFFLTAVVLGKVKDNHEFELKSLENDYILLEERFKELQDIHNKTKFIKEELRKQIIGARESILSLYEIASSLETLDPEEVFTETMAILANFLKAKSASIYTLNSRGDFLRLKLSMGRDLKLSNSIDVKKAPYLKPVVEDRRIIKIGPETDADDMPLMSAPIVENNEVLAVVNIHDMEFERVTDYAYHLFKLIIDWVNKALARAVKVDRELNTGRFYNNTRIMKHEYFTARLKEENKRSRRFNIEYGLLKYRLKHMTLEQFDSKISKVVRDVDVIGYHASQNLIYLLLPATPKTVLWKVDQRIQAEFDSKLERVK